MDDSTFQDESTERIPVLGKCLEDFAPHAEEVLDRLEEPEPVDAPEFRMPSFVWVFAGAAAILLLVGYLAYAEGRKRERENSREVIAAVPEAYQPAEKRTLGPPPEAAPPELMEKLAEELPEEGDEEAETVPPRHEASAPEREIAAKTKPESELIEASAPRAEKPSRGFLSGLREWMSARTGPRSSDSIRRGRDFVVRDLDMEMVWVAPLKVWVGKTEVTQRQFQLGGGTVRSRFRGPELPVDSVSWNEAMEFCRRLNESEGKRGRLPEGYHYSLPTEEQWMVFVGDAGPENAVHGGRYEDGTRPPGTKPANNYRLFDVRGNLWEWTSTNYYRRSSYRKALRGGAYANSRKTLMDPRSRYYGARNATYFLYGFRVVLTKKDE